MTRIANTYVEGAGVGFWFLQSHVLRVAKRLAGVQLPVAPALAARSA